MNRSEVRSGLWSGDAKWVTSVFAFYLAAAVVTAAAGFSTVGLTGTIPISVLVCLVGCGVGLRSSKSFGGRHNFVGRLLLLFSISLLISSIPFLIGLFVLPTVPDLFVAVGAGLELITIFFVLSVIVAAYAIIDAARAVLDGFNKTILFRLVLALGIISLLEPLSLRGSVIQGLTLTEAFETDLPYVVVIFVLLSGALILTTQLGKWYATPGIAFTAYSYIVLGIVPSLVRGLVLGSPIPYHIQVFLFLVSWTSSFFLIGIGVSRVRPRIPAPAERAAAGHEQPANTGLVN